MRWMLRAAGCLWRIATGPAGALIRVHHARVARGYDRLADKLEDDGRLWPAQRLRILAADRRKAARR